MTRPLQDSRVDLDTLPQKYREGTVCPTELNEMMYEWIAHCAVPHIQALAALAETRHGMSRITRGAT